MLEELPSEGDVIALRVSGRLERDEIERMLDRLEKALENERVNMFVEVAGYTGFDAEGLPEQLRRGGRLLGKLRRLDRVAIVTDQPWVRGLARVESALLPKVRYEIFGSDERDRALAWVRGERSLPRDPALKILETNRPNVIGFEIDGKLSAAELGAVADYFNARLGRGPLLRVLGRIKRFAGADLAGLADRNLLTMKRAALDGVERYAVVGGPSWMAAWLALIGPLVKIDVRHFEDEERAWEWLGASVTAERPLVGEPERRVTKGNGRGELQPRE